MLKRLVTILILVCAGVGLSLGQDSIGMHGRMVYLDKRGLDASFFGQDASQRCRISMNK